MSHPIVNPSRSALAQPFPRPGRLVRGLAPKEIVVDSILPESMARFPWAGHLGLKLLDQVVELEIYKARKPGDLDRTTLEKLVAVGDKAAVSNLVLLDTAFALERLRDHMDGPVIVIARQIRQRDCGVRKLGLDHAFDLGTGHRHGGTP